MALKKSLKTFIKGKMNFKLFVEMRLMSIFGQNLFQCLSLELKLINKHLITNCLKNLVKLRSHSMIRSFRSSKNRRASLTI